MMTTLWHRGPDDRGVWTNGSVGFAHTRLSIIDLTADGHQPMVLPDETVSIAFNGEVYNFQDLRNQLKEKGHAFRSRSDTEVILHGYREWGREVFGRLRGMFAVALWDSREQELVLARDRVGKKPLYYGWHDGVFLFGSESKALLAWPGFKREADLEAIHHFLTFEYVPAPCSAFKNIRKLPHASYIVIDRKGQIREHSYWKLPRPVARGRVCDAQVMEELVNLLGDSVRRRMVADVPVGAFLSGGVDSSAVVALMAAASNVPVKTFCIGFEEEAFDERRYARMVAERYGTEHHEFVVRPDAISVIPTLTWHYGEPFADPSAIPTYYVSAIARQYVTVVLNGDGGDENFLGYGRYKACQDSAIVNRLPPRLRRIAEWALAKMPAGADRWRALRVVRRCLERARVLDSRRYAPSIVYFYETDKQEGYADVLRPFLDQSSLDLLEPWFQRAPSYLAGAGWADIETYLPDDLLVKVDIASMAHGLEARSPLLDHELMEWAAKLPAREKMRGGEGKALLKKAMEPYLPHEVLYRPKMGFGVPIELWLKEQMRDYAYDILLSRQAIERGLFRPEFVRRLLDEHCAGVRLHHTRLWAMLMLEQWYRMWIDPLVAPLVAPSKPDLAYSN